MIHTVFPALLVEAWGGGGGREGGEVGEEGRGVGGKWGGVGFPP